LKNRGLLASLQKRQKHDLAVWELQRVMMDCDLLFVDLSEDRGCVFDLGPPRHPRTFPPNIGFKNRRGSEDKSNRQMTFACNEM
jgi:hypothetical protein